MLTLSLALTFSANLEVSWPDHWNHFSAQWPSFIDDLALWPIYYIWSFSLIFTHMQYSSEYGSDQATGLELALTKQLTLSWLWPSYWPWVGCDQGIDLELAVTKLLTLSWLWPSYWPWVWLWMPWRLTSLCPCTDFRLTGDIDWICCDLDWLWVWLWPHDLLVPWLAVACTLTLGLTIIWTNLKFGRNLEWPWMGGCNPDWPWV